VGPTFLTIDQYAGAANKGFFLLLFRVCTRSPPDFQIFVYKVNVTDTTVRHPKRLPQVLHVLPRDQVSRMLIWWNFGTE